MIFSVEHGHEVVKEVQKCVVDEWTVTQNGTIIGILPITEWKQAYVCVVPLDGNVNVKLWMGLVVACRDDAGYINHGG